MGKRFAILAVLFALAWVYFSDRPIAEPVYNVGDGTFQIPGITPTPADPRVGVIEKVNEQNRLVTSFEGELSIDTKKRFIHLHGTVAFQKEKNFRLQIHSRMGKEADLGSNETEFWFSSSQYHDGTYYHCRHELLEKARLKPLFNPVWVMESLGYSPVPTENVKITNHGSYIGVVRETTDAAGNPCRIVILIEPKKPRVCGYYLYNKTGEVEGSSEVTKYDRTGVYPRRWSMRWNKEGLSMELELLNPSVNRPVNPAQWQMPKTKKSVDMSRN